MKLLALETATEACSVALWVDGEIFSQDEWTPQQHTKHLFPMLESLIQKAKIKKNEIDCVAYGHGPGSFTGVRIAASMAQGIALGCQIPVVGISTLQAIAHRVWRETGQNKILVAIDARMQEVYWGCYKVTSSGKPNCVVEDRVSTPDTVTVPDGSDWVGAGNGWRVYANSLSERCEGIYQPSVVPDYPSAQDILLLAKDEYLCGHAVSPEFAMPVYLRDKVALTEKERNIR